MYSLLFIIYYLLILFFALYSLHRFFIIFLYVKHYKKSAHEVLELKENDRKLPFVTIQIPIYNEFYVAKRIIETVVQLSYPKHKLDIQILDDSTDETSDIIKQEMRRWNKNGLQIFYYHRTNRTDFKAGALKEGLKHAKGEIIALFDADFLPAKDFLLKTVGYFRDPKVGVLQTRWTYLNAQNSIITKSQCITLDAHFQLEHTARAFSGRFLNFNGTAGLLRKSAILEVGNWQGDTLTEDLDISYRMQLQGYQVIYLPFVECLSELPESMMSLKNQQARWTQGSIQVAKKLFIPIVRSPFSWKIKLEALIHLCAPIAYIGSFLLSVLMPILFLLVPDVKKLHFVWPEISLSILLVISLGTYYLYAQKELKKSWAIGLKNLPSLLSMGAVFCIVNSWAALKGIFSKKYEFVRTPKYNYGGDSAKVKAKKYCLQTNYFLNGIEIIFLSWLNISFYFVLMNGDWLRLPLYAILLWGFNYNFYLILFHK